MKGEGRGGEGRGRGGEGRYGRKRWVEAGKGMKQDGWREKCREGKGGDG